MAYLDIEKIINGTPEKRIFNGYQMMKEHYDENSAKQYQSIYKVEPLSAILQNSPYIFSESYYGMDFYQNLIFESSNCLFTKYEEEYEKIRNYVEQYQDQMENKQRIIYESLLEEIQETIKKEKNAILLANYIKENVDDMIEENLSKAIYQYRLYSECSTDQIGEIEKAKDTVISIFESIEEPIVALLYLPFVSAGLGGNQSGLNEHIVKEFVNTEPEFDSYVKSVILSKKLIGDEFYKTSFGENVFNPKIRLCLESYQSENLVDKMNTLLATTAEKEHLIYHATAESAVNDLFDQLTGQTLVIEDEVQYVSDIVSTIYETTSDLLLLEYYASDNPLDKAEHYDLIQGDVTLEEAIGQMIAKEDSSGIFTEVEKMNTDEEDFPTLSNARTVHNKPEEGFFRRMQNKMQDNRIQNMKKKSEKLRKQMDRELALKSAAEGPKDAIENVKQKAENFDEWDDKRRKDYMAKPGYRKKWFKNLKLALLYGGVAAYKIAALPVVFMARHFSKQKDRRIRNELIAEIETDIKVCEEKINDAQSEGDKQKKYALIRIKDELTRNLNRVKFNSKYI